MYGPFSFFVEEMIVSLTSQFSETSVEDIPVDSD